MLALVASIPVLNSALQKEDVDGRDKPDHDGVGGLSAQAFASSCPIARIKERHRWHVAIRGERRAVGRYVRALARRPPPGGELRLAVDRDPVSLL